uniref:Uncharacterized protein n=1 Tax=Rhizophora mucronata TaxID=61149 RepID=A0A2P2QI08_RHIMU
MCKKIRKLLETVTYPENTTEREGKLKFFSGDY